MTLSQPDTKEVSTLILKSQDEQQMVAIACQLAVVIARGDVLFLKGDLGAGKSTLARALIRAVAQNPDLEVPSPTFPLLIPYETARMPIAHYDLYRLGAPEELEELGLFDHISTHLTLIEWPEQLGHEIIADHLEIELTEAEEGAKRTLTCRGVGAMAAKLARLAKMRAFLGMTDWDTATWSYLQGDASTRSYVRLQKHNGETALFMNAPPQPDGPIIKDDKPYSQIAHLAEDMTSFVAISKTLCAEGFHLPKILKADIEEGLLLISDFGNDQYYHLIMNEGHEAKALYLAAIETLARLRQVSPCTMSTGNKTYHLPPFDFEALSIEVELTTDWYWPFVKNEPCPASAKAEFMDIWRKLYQTLHESDHHHWILRDFHSPNIMRLKGQGTASVGIIDFQDALIGNAAYDVASLCQDARLTIPPTLEAELLAHYIAVVKQQEPTFDEAAFKRDYAILGAQRASKLLGIFVRLNVRDKKPHYLAHLPRIWLYLEQSLPHPECAALKAWFDRHFPIHLRGGVFTTHNKAS